MKKISYVTLLTGLVTMPFMSIGIAGPIGTAIWGICVWAAGMYLAFTEWPVKKRRCTQRTFYNINLKELQDEDN